MCAFAKSCVHSLLFFKSLPLLYVLKHLEICADIPSWVGEVCMCEMEASVDNRAMWLAAPSAIWLAMFSIYTL